MTVRRTGVSRPLLALALGAACVAAQAQVATDGTLGTATTLQGPDFRIADTLGRTAGTNLFHSFDRFSLAQGQSATFLGPGSILNVIARVTGGNLSSIDGRISTAAMPSASFWLINPAGIAFGPNASLDVAGSVYLASADYLVLGTGTGAGRFDARTPSQSTLVSAPPSAFGFATATPAPVTFTGSVLALRTGTGFTVVGGGVALDDARISTLGGKVEIGAVASAGEARFASNGTLDYSTFSRLGDVALRQTLANANAGRANVNVGGTGTTTAGTVRIRGGRFVAENGMVIADNFGAQRGGDIDVSVSGEFHMSGNSLLSTTSRRSGDSGAIHIAAGDVLLDDNSKLRSDARLGGGAGDISIVTGGFTMRGNTLVQSQALGLGNGGSIDIHATGDVSLSGTAGIRSETDVSGDAGDITLIGRNISIRENGTLQTSAFAGSSGDGGTISIGTTGRFELVGTGGAAGSSAVISTASNGSGIGGNLTIDAAEVLIDAGATIRSVATAGGDAGDITVDSGAIRIDGGSAVDSLSSGSGDGGTTLLRTGAGGFALTNSSRVSAEALGTGLAGDIGIEGGSLLIDHSRIATSAAISDGGNIAMFSNGDVLITESVIETSVRSGVGNGGNIVIGGDSGRPEFLIARGSRVQANAFGGNGGNIELDARFLIISSDSVVEASSTLGIDGEISFATPEVDLSSFLPLADAQPDSGTGIAVDMCGRGSRQSRLVVGSVARSMTIGACDGP